MRICSLLPAATEILFAIGAGSHVVGVTHECDYPPEAAARPALIHPRIDVHAAAGEIDRQVRECVERGESVYVVDGERLRNLNPDLIVTQELCHVCAASPDDLAAALARFDAPPRLLALTPKRLADVWQNVRALGDATGSLAAADQLIAQLQSRLGAIGSRMQAAAPVRVLCLEWLDPPYVAGHWVPEMVELAGGIAVLGKAGVPSVALEWEEVLSTRPDVVILMPCGYGLQKALDEYSHASMPRKWWELEAVRQGRVWAADANSFFARPGPRLVEGVEILAHVMHPELAVAPIPPGSLALARRNVAPETGAASSRS